MSAGIDHVTRLGLKTKPNRENPMARPKRCQGPVIIATPLSQTVSGPVKSHKRHNDNVRDNVRHKIGARPACGLLNLMRPFLQRRPRGPG